MDLSFIIIFHVLVLAMLAIDLFVFNRKNHAISIRESLIWSAVWIGTALLFDVYVYFDQGQEAALTFITGYVLEKSLSIDNLFVFILIFSSFQIPRKYQHKILFWGIIGAVLLRAGFIFAGVALIENFHFTLYILGAILVYSGYKIFRENDGEEGEQQNFIINWLSKHLPVTAGMHNGKFWVREKGKRMITPLFLALLTIEISDVIFAIDSVPAVLSISTDALIIYTSNIFAILGLRALFFAVEGMINQFHYLKYGLSVILIFVGLKMLLADVVEISTGISLAFILLVITTSIIISLRSKKPAKQETTPHGE